MFRLTRRRLNFAFWVFFIFAGAILIAGFIASRIFADMLLSAVVIAIGFHGLLEEFTHRENMKAFKRLDGSLQQLTEWIEKSHLFAKSIKERHELRLYHLDIKRAQAEQRLEKKNRELSKRIVDLENKFNSLKKSISGEKYKPLTKLEKRIAKAVTVLRKEGMITPATYSRSVRVSRKIARNDLKKMAGMNIVKKRGKGRNAYYILAV
jgi:predicted HTH transcriptional regulator